MQKRRLAPAASAQVYEIRAQCADKEDYLVAKAISLQNDPPSSDTDSLQLDNCRCYVLHLPHQLYVWQGSDCPQEAVQAGMKAAGQLQRYEGAPAAVLVKQGECGGSH